MLDYQQFQISCRGRNQVGSEIRLSSCNRNFSYAFVSIFNMVIFSVFLDQINKDELAQVLNFQVVVVVVAVVGDYSSRISMRNVPQLISSCECTVNLDQA